MTLNAKVTAKVTAIRVYAASPSDLSQGLKNAEGPCELRTSKRRKRRAPAHIIA
jgi:hypothetical protein